MKFQITDLLKIPTRNYCQEIKQLLSSNKDDKIKGNQSIDLNEKMRLIASTHKTNSKAVVSILRLFRKMKKLNIRTQEYIHHH